MATEAPFPEQEYQDRYQRAQALMERDGLDALVISERNNYWYFSGLISYQLDHIQRPQICFLPKKGKPTLLVYGNDKAEDVFGTHEKISRNDMVCRSVKKVHDQIAASAYPKMPLIWTEYNAAYDNEPAVTDSAYMGPFLANTIRTCDGLADIMSYWTFSDVFEEQGVVKTPFYGGFGLLAERSIPKPVFNDFALLHRLGETRLDAASDSLLVTRRKDGTLAIAAWNLFLPEEVGSAKTMTLRFKGLQATASDHEKNIEALKKELGALKP